jgi:hypothetical protein
MGGSRKKVQNAHIKDVLLPLHGALLDVGPKWLWVAGGIAFRDITRIKCG